MEVKITFTKHWTFILTFSDMKTNKIFTNGCFDIIHRGHIELLKFCETLGDVYVGLNSDLSIKDLKGFDRPINNEIDRKFALESLFNIKRVIIFNEENPLNLIKLIEPDIIVKGGDYKLNEVIGKDLAKVIIFPLVTGYSSTKIINQIRKDLKN